MTLSPLEVESVRFRRGLLGYDRIEVERFVAEVCRTLEEHIARTSELQKQLDKLRQELQQHRDNEELLKSSVMLAQRTSDELIGAAHQRAAAVIEDAQLEAQRMRQELATLRSDREHFEFAFHGLLSGFIRRLEAGNPALVPRSEGGPTGTALAPPLEVTASPQGSAARPSTAEAGGLSAMAPAVVELTPHVVMPPASGTLDAPLATASSPEADADALDFAQLLENVVPPPR